MHHHQAHTKAVEQRNVMNDIAEIVMLERLAGQHQHKGFSPVLIDIRRGMAKPFNVVLSVGRHDLFSSKIEIMQA